MDARIRKDEPPNRAMYLGIAYHKLLEQWREHYEKGMKDTLVEVELFTFDYLSCIQPIVDLMDDAAVFEVFGQKEMETDYGNIVVRGFADIIRGNVIYDMKTTEKSHKLSRYEHSAQWKSYCWMFGFEHFEYRCVKLVDDSSIIQAKHWDKLPLQYCPSVHEHELRELMNGLIHYHHARELEEYLYLTNRKRGN